MNQGKTANKYDDEFKKVIKIVNFRFSHKYKKIGLISAILIFGFLLGYKFLGSNDLLVKDICRTVILLFLLLASLSKERVEDEYINHVRYQSYVVAFVFATAYSIGLPLIAFVLDILITRITDGGNVNFYEVSAFEVMFMLLCFQLLYFETLKRLGKCEIE